MNRPSAMTTRVLPREEWPRLAHTELGGVWQALSPEWCQIVVVEEHDEILACWALMTFKHVEGAWIHPAHRGKAAVAKQLLGAMTHLMRDNGVEAVMTHAPDDAIAGLLRHVGAVPVDEAGTLYYWAPREG